MKPIHIPLLIILVLGVVVIIAAARGDHQMLSEVWNGLVDVVDGGLLALLFLVMVFR